MLAMHEWIFLFLMCLCFVDKNYAQFLQSELTSEVTASALRPRYAVSYCNRQPPGVLVDKPEPQKKNDFSIRINGAPTKYVPSQVYDVSIEGAKWTPHPIEAPDNTTTDPSVPTPKPAAPQAHAFIGFTLIVVSAEANRINPNVGHFKLSGDLLSRYSDDCPNGVVSTSNVPKSLVTVQWIAPPSGSGCVRFNASVAKEKKEWYKDDGDLSKELCQDFENTEEPTDLLEECCSCDEAKYEVSFEVLWSRFTHPKGFPANHWDTKFSDLIGASHAVDFKMWQYGEMASEGVKTLADTGTTQTLEAELKEESDKIRTIIKARGLKHPNLHNKTFAVFRVDRRNHVMSVLSQMEPSPDWIVGVSTLELCLRNCSWALERTLNLYPYDAGSSDGNTYIVEDKQPSVPQQRIRKITSSYPEEPDAPFYDPTGTPMKPVAKLTIVRQKIYEKSTCETHQEEGGRDLTPFTDPREECAVLAWSPFGPCDVTCGPGIKMRGRAYVNQKTALAAECKSTMVHKEKCERDCNPNGINCQTYAWSEWSECSVTCGKGYQNRHRIYQNSIARKLCSTELMDKKPCEAEMSECLPGDISPYCRVTDWAEWSPCTASCGEGMEVRTRQYKQEMVAKVSNCRVELQQERACTGEHKECQITHDEAAKICHLDQDPGPCRGAIMQYYYDTRRQTCMQFYYTGCKGNKNRFQNYEQCNSVCAGQAGDDRPHDTQPSQPPKDCRVSKWSEWGHCTRTCGNGRRERRRMIIENPENGGAACPEKLLQKRRCKDNVPCPVDCVLSQWGHFGQCSATCGNSFRERHRTVKKIPSSGGAQCANTAQRVSCEVPPCRY